MKILYLPTGEYITFKKPASDTTNMLGWYTSNLTEEIITSYSCVDPTDINRFIKILCSIKKQDNFAKRNQLIFPLLKEHFEIIED